MQVIANQIATAASKIWPQPPASLVFIQYIVLVSDVDENMSNWCVVDEDRLDCAGLADDCAREATQAFAATQSKVAPSSLVAIK